MSYTEIFIERIQMNIMEYFSCMSPSYPNTFMYIYGWMDG